MAGRMILFGLSCIDALEEYSRVSWPDPAVNVGPALVAVPISFEKPACRRAAALHSTASLRQDSPGELCAQREDMRATIRALRRHAIGAAHFVPLVCGIKLETLIQI